MSGKSKIDIISDDIWTVSVANTKPTGQYYDLMKISGTYIFIV